MLSRLKAASLSKKFRPTDARQFAGSESSFLKTQLASGFIINRAGPIKLM
jgi:hypothetical protein